MVFQQPSICDILSEALGAGLWDLLPGELNEPVFFNPWSSCGADFNAENIETLRRCFLSVEEELTQQPVFYFMFVFQIFYLTLKKNGKQAFEPFDVPLGRMCWTSIYSDGRFFSMFFPTRGSHERRRGRDKKKVFFDVSQTIVSLSAQSHVRKFYRHLPADTKASEATGEWT